MDVPGICPYANHTDLNLSGTRRSDGRCGTNDPADGARRLETGRHTVIQENPIISISGLFDPSVRFSSFRYRKGPADEGGKIEPTRAEQVQEELEVPLLGPTNVPPWVVATFQLITWVITARTVGTR